ncbi:hypothetical protein BGZ97_010972 [Linnemannia gamsii]|uniref:NACHT domain-containing protein n=1 Tax=Linnemannia gamsii TaxID=64522 RepID=A0A9P6UMA7_9FUNG|nr:hypothetical protein BGZ97_010972 [Linnemannia gamsii]
MDFLAEIYRNDSIRRQEVGVNQRILHILWEVFALPDLAMSNHAQRLLRGLEEEDRAGKQTLFRAVLADPPNPYPLKVRLPAPMSSPLLGRAQAISDLDYKLYRLRVQRLKERENALYIPLNAKPTLQSSDNTLFPLMEKAQEFLLSDQQVLLLLGDSGAGKSTFNLELEHALWKDYKRGDRIPLHVHLPTIRDPTQDLIRERLRKHDFSETQIMEMKENRRITLICDGYDESQLEVNLHTTNNLNKSGQWNAKVVMSCRTQYLGSNYRDYFQPSGDRYDRTARDSFQEATIASFSRAKIQQYIEQYLQRISRQTATPDQPAWEVKDYMDRLTAIPHLMDLVSNPFLLTLALEALPQVAAFEKDFSTIRITRVGLYDGFARQWLENNRKRLLESPLNESEKKEFKQLAEEGFVGHGIRFQKALAEAIFRKQGGQPVVRYNRRTEGGLWKAEFFSLDSQAKLLREASTLTRSNNEFRFIHRSLLEYFYSRSIYDPFDEDGNPDIVSQGSLPDLSTALSQRSIINEPSVLQFLAERVEQEADCPFQRQLRGIVECSKTDNRTEAAQAAANAISILVRAGTPFICADLRGIKIPGADLTGGQFDSADFREADLSDVNLRKAWLRQANFSKCRICVHRGGHDPRLCHGNMDRD